MSDDELQCDVINKLKEKNQIMREILGVERSTTSKILQFQEQCY